MKNKNIQTKSRRHTPWTNEPLGDSSPSGRFIDIVTERDYSHRHRAIDETGEVGFLNSKEPLACPYCGAISIIKQGFGENHMRRYGCKKCGRRFNILTNTIFDNHKLSISEWVGFLLDIIGFSSFNLTSKINRNSINTTRYWMKKTFVLLDGIQDNIVLENTVWIDETFYKVRSTDIQKKPDGKEYAGLSRNQMCIGVATDKTYSIFIYQGLGKTSGKRTLNTFGAHIGKGATLIHDKEKSHKKLIDTLGLKSIEYDSKEIKKMPDNKNPLRPVNELCDMMQKFLDSHSGFDRSLIQGYLNLLSVIINPPYNKYEKIQLLLELALTKPVLLRYRDQKG